MVKIYDTTLRDGTQTEKITLSTKDKLRITEKLDSLGIHYIEGGWPGANPTDDAYFQSCGSLDLKNSKIAAFGRVRRMDTGIENDKAFLEVINSGASVVTLFGKTSPAQVTKALQTSLDENLRMIEDSVHYAKTRVEEVFFDAEHFFDGYLEDPDYALKCLLAAGQGGADVIVLCDTNGGMLPHQVKEIFEAAAPKLKTGIGIHAHNDSDTAVANSLEAVRSGAVMVQGTMNGYGERCGNANLCSVIPNLALKMGIPCIQPEQLRRLASISRYISEIANQRHQSQFPFVGKSAFTHKAGVHVSAIERDPVTYEHIDPEAVGNTRRILVSELAGKSAVTNKLKSFGLDIEDFGPDINKILENLKLMDSEGYQFESAEASFELLVRKILGDLPKYFDLEGFRVIDEKREENMDTLSEATIKVSVGGLQEHTASEGNGPVNALDHALRKALENFYPALREVHLTDYKVRVLDAKEGTAAKVRVIIESQDEDASWTTVGVNYNVIEASWQALTDSIVYKLLKDELKSKSEK